MRPGYFELGQAIERGKQNPSDDETFKEVISRTISTGVASETLLARTLLVARPTIRRWAAGESAPHPLGRRSVYDGIYKMLHEKTDEVLKY